MFLGVPRPVVEAPLKRILRPLLFYGFRDVRTALLCWRAGERAKSLHERAACTEDTLSLSLGSSYKSKSRDLRFSRNVDLEIFLLIQTKNLEKKISRKKISRFWGVTSQNIFARLISRFFSRFSFLEIYVLSYTAVNLEIFTLKKSRDFLSFLCAVLVPNNFVIISIIW